MLFFGMQSNFSSPALQHLLLNGIEVCAVVMPAAPIPGIHQAALELREPPQKRRLPLLNSAPSIMDIAWRQRIPVWEVRRPGHRQVIATLSAYRPDVICVACFSRILPRSLIELPRLGSLNVHPALLPANRGPVPLFWTFREGEERSGVTIHLMSEKMDSGAILAQESIEVPDGLSYEQLEMQCAQKGGRLLARSVRDLYEGRATPIEQDEAQSSYHSFPEDEDFVVPAHAWSARHVYNFICGIGHWDRPVELHVSNQRFLVRDAISYSIDSSMMLDDYAYVWVNNTLVVRCKDGFVVVKPDV